MSPLPNSSSSSSSSENHVARGLKADPRAEELVAIGDGVTLQEHQHPQTERRTGRQPLAPVQSSKKRKRERPSVDGDEYYEEDTVSLFPSSLGSYGWREGTQKTAAFKV